MDSLNFSVLMSVYKNEKAENLKEAFESIYKNQILKPNEIVLVEDGKLTRELYIEIDNQKKILGDILKIIKLEKNSGLGIALQKGLLECKNELVARMDTDDISSPDRFFKQIEIFSKDKEVGVLGGNIIEFIGKKDNIVGVREVKETHFEIEKDMKKRCAVNHVTVMLKKSLILEAGNYLEWFCNEDYYLWIRLIEKNVKFKNILEDLVYVRVGEEMYGRRGGIKYFKSEAKLQNYMLRKKIISFPRYINNVIIRFIVQLIMPNFLRKILYKKIFRSNKRCENVK